MSPFDPNECCPRFDPTPWQDQRITWREKTFLKDRVRSILHIPLNFGSVMIRNMAKIEAAGAKADPMIVLSDENSLWGSDVYIETAGPVPDAQIVRLGGTFLSRVFEGPYKDAHKWCVEMQKYVAGQGETAQKTYFYYTTCPGCAKKYGKNYVVLLTQI